MLSFFIFLLLFVIYLYWRKRDKSVQMDYRLKAIVWFALCLFFRSFAPTMKMTPSPNATAFGGFMFLISMFCLAMAAWIVYAEQNGWK